MQMASDEMQLRLTPESVCENPSHVADLSCNPQSQPWRDTLTRLLPLALPPSLLADWEIKAPQALQVDSYVLGVAVRTDVSIRRN